MTITVEQVQGKENLGILVLEGDLDASNYRQAIEKATEAYEAGTRNLLIDMTKLAEMASSGMSARHSIALLMRGEAPPDLEFGWEAFRTLDRDRESGPQEHVKLLNPDEKVKRTFEITGLLEYFEIFTDRKEAIAAFN